MRDRLLNVVESARAMHLAFVERLTDDEKLASGTFEAWSGKDVVGHTLFWIENFNIHLQQAMHGQPLTDYEAFDAHNAEDYPRKKPLTWAEMLTLIDTTFEALTRHLKEFPVNEADLTRRDWENWSSGPTIETSVLSAAISHPLFHFISFLDQAKRDEAIEALSQQALAAVSDYPRARGAIYYNLACQDALRGRDERALAGLREALALRPDLKAHARDNTTFAALHDRQDFQALVAAEAGPVS